MEQNSTYITNLHKDILVAVKYPHSDALLFGEKNLILQKRMPKRTKNQTLWFYEQGRKGSKRIVGSAELHVILPMDSKMDAIINAGGSGLRPSEIAKLMPCYAWFIKNPRRLPMKLALEDVAIYKRPRTWMYLDEQQAELLHRLDCF